VISTRLQNWDNHSFSPSRWEIVIWPLLLYMGSKNSLPVGGRWNSFLLWILSGPGDMMWQWSNATSSLFKLKWALCSSGTQDAKFGSSLSAMSLKHLKASSYLLLLKPEVKWNASEFTMSTNNAYQRHQQVKGQYGLIIPQAVKQKDVCSRMQIGKLWSCHLSRKTNETLTP
jgi:hypothetical protein